MSGRDGFGVVDLGREDVKRGLADGSMVLVDVRERQEFAAGHIPGSVSHPLSTFDPEAIRELGGRIVFSCAAGIRSARAVEFAVASGLHAREHYLGGLKDWMSAGEAVASPYGDAKVPQRQRSDGDVK